MLSQPPALVVFIFVKCIKLLVLLLEVAVNVIIIWLIVVSFGKRLLLHEHFDVAADITKSVVVLCLRRFGCAAAGAAAAAAGVPHIEFLSQC